MTLTLGFVFALIGIFRKDKRFLFGTLACLCFDIVYAVMLIALNAL